jgi:hypothetical protein
MLGYTLIWGKTWNTNDLKKNLAQNIINKLTKIYFIQTLLIMEGITHPIYLFFINAFNSGELIFHTIKIYMAH